MTTKFKYTGPVEVKHLNTRKEGPDDDKVLAVDLKVTAIASASILDYFDEHLADFLFTDFGDVRNIMIGEIPMRHVYEDYRMNLAGVEHFGVTLKKFLIEPLVNREVRLTFQITFQPSSTEIAQIAEYLQDEIFIKLQSANSELDFTIPALKTAGITSMELRGAA